MIGQRVIGLSSVKVEQFDQLRKQINADFMKKVADHFTNEQWTQLYKNFENEQKTRKKSTRKKVEYPKLISGKESYAQLRTWASTGLLPEAWTQFFMNHLFGVMDSISKELSLEHLFFHDISTSSEIRDIHNRKAKIDGTLLASRHLSWMNIVSCFEIKKEIKLKANHDKVVGQLTERITHMREFQVTRKLFYGFVCSFDQLEFMKFSADSVFMEFLRSDLLDFRIDSTNHAFQLLCGLYLSAPEALGHYPALTPSSVVTEDGTPFSNFEWIYSVERSPVPCRILMASTKDGESLIIKAAKDRENEVKILKMMNEKGVTGIPRVVHDKVIITYPESKKLHGFALLPVASRFPYVVNISDVVKILDGVLKTLIQTKAVGYMYTDLSNGNILNVNGESLLVDWQHAVPVGNPAPAFTFHYASLRIILHNLWNQRPVHSMRDNLESLFFVALDQFSNGRYVHRATGNIIHEWQLAFSCGTSNGFVFVSRRRVLDTDGKIGQILHNFEVYLERVKHEEMIQFLKRFHGLLYGDITCVLTSQNMDDLSELRLIEQVQSLFNDYRNVEIETTEFDDEADDGTDDEIDGQDGVR